MCWSWAISRDRRAPEATSPWMPKPTGAARCSRQRAAQVYQARNRQGLFPRRHWQRRCRLHHARAAPFMIGSISTFSLAAAACNRHGMSVLPASRLLCYDAKLCASLTFSRIKFAPFRGLWGGKYECSQLKSGGGLNSGRTATTVLRSLVMGEGVYNGFSSGCTEDGSPDGTPIDSSSWDINKPENYPKVLSWLAEDKKDVAWQPPWYADPNVKITASEDAATVPRVVAPHSTSSPITRTTLVCRKHTAAQWTWSRSCRLSCS